MEKVSFQQAAWYYDTLAKLVFGRSIENAQLAHLSTLSPKSKVLIIGGGSGWILEAIIAHTASLEITYLETSTAMLNQARKRYEAIQRKTYLHTKVHFVQGSAEDLSETLQFDALATFFLLDLYNTNDAWQLMSDLYRRLKHEGLWLYADFEQPRSGWKSYWQNWLLRMMYLFFSLTTNLKNQHLPDFSLLFNKLGMMPIRNSYYYGKFIRSSVYRKE
jgi:ubiquinone/menaquinone biosynthesis C-methylase UbiE